MKVTIVSGDVCLAILILQFIFLLLDFTGLPRMNPGEKDG